MHKIFLGVVLATSFAFAHAAEFPANRTALLESFNSIADDPGYAKFVLEPLIQRNKIGDGLVVVGGRPASHEIRTAQKLADYWNQFGYTFVLMSTMNGDDVPGFDGILLDEEFEAVANISLKTLHKPSSEVFLKTMREGLASMQKFSKVENWVTHLMDNTGWGLDHAEEHLFLSDGQYDRFVHLRDSLQFQIAALGVKTKRPSWIVMDLEDYSRMDKRDFEKLELIFSHGTFEQGMVLTSEGVYRVKGGNLVYKRLKDCTELLKL